MPCSKDWIPMDIAVLREVTALRRYARAACVRCEKADSDLAMSEAESASMEYRR